MQPHRCRCRDCKTITHKYQYDDIARLQSSYNVLFTEYLHQQIVISKVQGSLATLLQGTPAYDKTSIGDEGRRVSSRIFTARCTLVRSAVLRLHVVCLSVCNVGEL